MINTCFDDDLFFFDTTRKSASHHQKTGILENHNGDIMLVAEALTIQIEEEIVTTPEMPHLKVPLTFKSAMWLGIGFLAVALSGAWAMYAHLDNKLETYRSGTESRIEASRASLDSKIDSKVDGLRSATDAHFESARVETKADNAAITNQLQAITNSLSEINGKLSKDN
ncbi:hypothetical protein N7922_14065 [Kosakonia sp. ML.JS2a]|uniref:hypothetical protein n=1 Tax=Kosakonia sp. ML.JS2a TaxID=2980557 RepID=UPI0021D9981E|nr:hypothetical protein [Kosakonia sp. ML.JS2a]UXY09016.1 hypothetical protein N7922_14065 [Kosakonia sp. ML.JS2a]